jgi:hypothetical protein
MGNNEEINKILSENLYLKNELLKTLDEKEELILICEKLLAEKDYIEKRYNNLKNSRLGKIVVWNWQRRKKANGERQSK